MGKEAIKKSATLISLIGPSTPPDRLDLITVPIRSTDGSTVPIRDDQNTGTDANVGDIVKYINIRVQTGPADETSEDDTSGWLEWAIVKFKETSSSPGIANTGIKTLGDICMSKYRGDCLLTGAIPVGGDQPSVLDIALKVPKVFIKMQLGSKLSFFFYFRSVNQASTSTTLNRCITSTYYKLYVQSKKTILLVQVLASQSINGGEMN